MIVCFVSPRIVRAYELRSAVLKCVVSKDRHFSN